MSKIAAVAFVVSLVSVVACAEVDPYGNGPKTNVSASTGKCGKKKSAAGGAMKGTDPSSLKACKGSKKTKGRCVPTAVLGSFAGTFEEASCGDDSECVPEELVKDGSAVKLTSCKAFGKEGRCFWPLAKDMLDQYELLKGETKDQCDSGMICAPCVNPLSGEETGVCSLGEGGGSAKCKDDDDDDGAVEGGTCPQVEPILDASTFPTEDCGTNMVCVEEGLVGAERAANLKACSKGRCAPKKSVERGGNYVPKTCRSTGDAEGRCLNVGIPMIGEQQALLPQADCDADERCAPCFDPRDGSDTMACRTASCDQPKEAAKPLESCCGGRARCVSAAQAGESAGELLADTCKGSTPLCAPMEFIPGGATPKKCATLLGLMDGICVAKCALSNSLKDVFQGDCAEDEMCAPCSFLPASVTACQTQ